MIADTIILGCHNNCIITNFLDDGADEVEYYNINIKILGGNVTSMSLIISNFFSIDADHNSYHGSYIIRFPPSLYILQ